MSEHSAVPVPVPMTEEQKFFSTSKAGSCCPRCCLKRKSQR